MDLASKGRASQRLKELEELARGAEYPRELAVDVMFALQEQYGYLTDEAVREASKILGMTPLEVDELATFYDFIYRRPVGRFVIRVCDSIVCWLRGGETVADHLQRVLGISMGQTTQDGLFTLMPVCCLGYCDMAPAIVVNSKVYGKLTPQRIEEIIQGLRSTALKAD